MLTTNVKIAVCIFLAVFFAISFRIQYLSGPIVDTHVWRQTHTYAIAKNYLTDFNIFNSRTNEITPSNNYDRLFLAEFPGYEYILAIILRMFGENIISARLFSAVLSAAMSVAIFFIGYRLFNYRVGLIAAVLFSFFPSSLFWGRSISPEIFALFCSTTSVALVVWKKYKIIAIVLFAFAVATKGYFAVLIVPVGYWVWWINRTITTKRDFFLFALGSLSLEGVWLIRWLMVPQSLRIPNNFFSYFSSSENIFVYLKTSNWVEILLKDRILGELLTPFFGILFIISIYILITETHRKSQQTLLLLWALVCLTTLILIPWANYHHGYYQLILIPCASLCIGYLLDILYFRKYVNPPIRILSILLFVFFFYFLAYLPFLSTKQRMFSPEVKYFDFTFDIQQVQRLLPIDKRVAILSDLDEESSSSLLNHIDRKGWIVPIQACNDHNDQYLSIREYKSLGASYFILPLESYYFVSSTCNRTRLFQQMSKILNPLYKGNRLAIFKL